MTTRREVVGALLALFGGVLLPEPVRDLIRVARPAGMWGTAIFPGDQFTITAQQYFEFSVLKPSSAGIISRIETDFLPNPAGPEIVTLKATKAEIEALERMVIPEREFLARLEARPFVWDDDPHPIWKGSHGKV
ncbi:MAG: hypothetical protein OEO20_11475 [Gemmatimonadota bacterium]|nr:hypothetical protein [Gemmatimonadota bacterium]MDH3366525.1 hypothetical protein [Gemmatimonadota bacterium]MDH3478914.1 hypothetical protein [Gemmatimonadota bacterium]MDH3571155.1 hypothetical protein [Gemmatimonadota bacterium]